jgi:hypothetical protein
MRPCRLIPSRTSLRRLLLPKTFFGLSLLLLTTSAPSSPRAQTPSQSTPAQLTPAQPTPHEGAPYTLHLYARLVELPTIILLPKIHASTPINPQTINITLDSGRPFHPSSIRLEGNDPLSLAILLDVSDDDHSNLLPALSQSFSAWLTGSFKPHDHLSIYSLHCDLLRSADAQPPNPALLQPALDRAIASSFAHDKKSRPSCPKAVGLRDSIYFIMSRLSELPGRHVLIILTDGNDEKGSIHWSDLASAATLHATTLFALAAPSLTLNQWGGDLNNLSQRSGGFFYSTTPAFLPAAMARFVELLRTRYILQFSMPEHLGAGIHQVNVTLTKTDATIRPSGITVPLPDPSLDHPPTDLPSEAPTPNR